VSNSGPLIHLGRTTCLELLFVLFDNILIPRKVYEEVVERGMEQGAPVALCVKELVDQGKIAVQQPKSSFKIDHSVTGIHSGELDAIALALELLDPVVLLDDHGSRNIARTLGLTIKSSLGIIHDSVKLGAISVDNGVTLVRKLARAMYLTSEVFDYVLSRIRMLE